MFSLFVCLKNLIFYGIISHKMAQNDMFNCNERVYNTSQVGGVEMDLKVSRKLKSVLQSLGYPFNSTSGALNTNIIDKNLNTKWTKDSLSYDVLDKEATDNQLLACCDVSNFYQFVPPYFAALSSNNGMQAITRLASYEQLIGPIKMGTFREGDNFRIHISYLKEYCKNSRFSLLVDQISLISLIRTGTNKEIKPVSIGCQYTYGPEITKYVGIKPQKSIDNYLVFREEDLLEPFSTQNDIIWDLIKPGLKQHIEDLNIDHSFSATVQNVLFKLVAGGNFQLKDVADTVGISSRTAQRWLKKENTTFEAQLKTVRKVLALNLLQDITLNTAEVSFLIGFKDVTSFYKAFKKWTGMTALNYRHKMILRNK